jgi:hypothetical protein
MGLDAMLQKCAYTGYQVWDWLTYEFGTHPFILLGVVIIIVAAFFMYKTEVRSK